MSAAWEVTVDDVADVLRQHGVSEMEAERIHGAYDWYEVEDAVLSYTDMDEQVEVALSVIEDVLISAGVLKPPKRYVASSSDPPA